MKMNQNTLQEQPAQPIHTEPVHPEDPAAPTRELPTEGVSTTAAPRQSSEYAYDPAKAARIADVLCELFDPEYILLFGKMAGKTPHSDTQTYDLLVITAGTPHYNWYDAKRYLKMRLPWVGHGAPYLNLYVHTLHDVEASCVPFIYLARREGVVLYRSHCRNNFPVKARYDPKFSVMPSELIRHLDRVRQLGEVVTGLCEKRIALYQQRTR